MCDGDVGVVGVVLLAVEAMLALCESGAARESWTGSRYINMYFALFTVYCV